MGRTFVCVTLLLIVSACDRSVRATDYDQSCAVDDDCIAIEEGDVCYHCGRSTAAINSSEARRLNDDRNAKVGACVLWDDVEADCFCGNVSIVACQDGQCFLEQSNCEPIVQPATFLITSPPLDRPVPTNVDVRGIRFGGGGPEDFAAVLLAGGEVVELVLLEDHCARINGCDRFLDLGLLSAGTTVELVVTIDGNEERHSIVIGEGPDLVPPVVSEIAVLATGVSARRSEEGAWEFETGVELVRPDVFDDVGLAGAALQRILDGGEPVLLEREDGFRDGPLVDSVSERENASEACYVFIAWDHAGNETATQPVCVDVAIKDAEKPFVCGAVGARAPLSVLGGILALCGMRRRFFKIQI